MSNQRGKRSRGTEWPNVGRHFAEAARSVELLSPQQSHASVGRALPLARSPYRTTDDPASALNAVTPAEDGTDAALAARGDVAAFRRLYHRHAPRMHSLARRLVGASEADDVVQDVFIRAWTRLDTFRAESAFATWLHRLATNVCLRRLEQSRRAAFDEPARLDGLPARAADPGMKIDLTTALDRLPPSLRCVVVLFDLEGYTHQEVAGLLGITTDSSKMRLSRARAVLRTILDDRSDR